MKSKANDNSDTLPVLKKMIEILRGAGIKFDDTAKLGDIEIKFFQHIQSLSAPEQQTKINLVLKAVEAEREILKSFDRDNILKSLAERRGTRFLNKKGIKRKTLSIIDGIFYGDLEIALNREKKNIPGEILNIIDLTMQATIINYYAYLEQVYKIQGVNANLPPEKFINEFEARIKQIIELDKKRNRTGENSRRLQKFYEECERAGTQIKKETGIIPSPKMVIEKAIRKIKNELPVYAEQIGDLLPESYQIKDKKFKYLYEKWYLKKSKIK